MADGSDAKIQNLRFSEVPFFYYLMPLLSSKVSPDEGCITTAPLLA